MEDFKVVYKNNRAEPAVFEGSRTQVVGWLMNNAAIAWDLEVWDGSTRNYTDAEEYVRSFVTPDRPPISAGQIDPDRTYHVYRKGHRDEPPRMSGPITPLLVQLVGLKDLGDYEVFLNDSSYMDAREFVTRYIALVGPAEPKHREQGESPDQKMLREELFDPVVHARNEMVYQLIRKAIRLADHADYVPELLARNTARDVIRLFY